MMIKINETIIVEGIYDKVKLEQFIDAIIFTTNGFALFKDTKSMGLIKRLAEKNGIVILTDSDRAGFLIRNHIKSFVQNQYIKHAYIPEIHGKEKRKAYPGKEGLLGVEGVDEDMIVNALMNAGCSLDGKKKENSITKIDLYRDGLTGKPGSSALRAHLLLELSLPSRISTNSLLQILNALYSFEEYKSLMGMHH